MEQRLQRKLREYSNDMIHSFESNLKKGKYESSNFRRVFYYNRFDPSLYKEFFIPERTECGIRSIVSIQELCKRQLRNTLFPVAAIEESKDIDKSYIDLKQADDCPNILDHEDAWEMTVDNSLYSEEEINESCFASDHEINCIERGMLPFFTTLCHDETSQAQYSLLIHFASNPLSKLETTHIHKAVSWLFNCPLESSINNVFFFFIPCSLSIDHFPLSSSWWAGNISLSETLVYNLTQDETFPCCIWTQEEIEEHLKVITKDTDQQIISSPILHGKPGSIEPPFYQLE